ncbi:MAG: hypothetical protein QM687_14875 [Ferruginibacter sp.]
MKSSFLFLLSACLLCSCSNKKQDKIIHPAKDTAAVKDSIPAVPVVAVDSTFTGNEMTDSIARVLAPVRENFKRINAIKEWTKIDTAELSGSTEGGELRYYYMYDRLQKIVRIEYGETYQESSEYYLLGNEPSFILERSLRYNRPMHYDSAAMKENKDTESFNIDKSTVQETRSYFIKDALVYQLYSGAEAKKKNYASEEKRLKESLEKLLKRVKKK